MPLYHRHGDDNRHRPDLPALAQAYWAEFEAHLTRLYEIADEEHHPPEG